MVTVPVEVGISHILQTQDTGVRPTNAVRHLVKLYVDVAQFETMSE